MTGEVKLGRGEIQRAERRTWLGRIPAAAGPVSIALIAFGVTAIWVRGIHTFSVMPDELGYLKQALTIARTGHPLGPHSFFFNSWGQLLPTILAPVFAVTGLVSAYYTAHTIGAFLLASTAIPAYLLARTVGLGRPESNLVAALSVAVPWLVLSGLIMTEDVAYPLATWALLAMVRALIEPSLRRDLVALVALGLAFTARSQFIVLGPLLLIALVIHEILVAVGERGDATARSAIRTAVWRALRGHRVLWVAGVIAGLLVLVLAARGSTASLLGNYAIGTQGSVLPAGSVAAGLEQLAGIAVGVGVVPLVLAVAWTLAALHPARPRRENAFAVVLLLVAVALVLLVGAFQQRFLDGATTDRYLFYLAPPLFCAFMLWTVDRRRARGVTLSALVAVGALVASHDLHTGPGYSILNASFNFDHVLSGQGILLAERLGIGGADPRILLVAAAALLTGVAVLMRSRLRRPIVAGLITVPFLAYGVVTAGYTMTHLTTEYAGISPAHPRQLGWIDRAFTPQADVGLVLAQNGSPTNTEYTWWQPYFWNESVRRAFILPGASSLAQGFVSTLTPDLRTGRLDGLAGVRELVKLSSDPRFLPEAAVLARNGALVAYRVSSHTPLAYATSGLTDGGDLGEPDARIRVFGEGRRPRRGWLTLAVLLGPVADCPCRLQRPAGGSSLIPRTAQSSPAGFRFPISLPAAGGHQDVPLRVLGRAGRWQSDIAIVKIALQTEASPPVSR